MPYATRNDATDAINGIIETVSKLTDSNYSMQVFSMTVDKLKESKNDKLWFSTLAKLAKMYMESGDIEKAESGI